MISSLVSIRSSFRRRCYNILHHNRVVASSSRNTITYNAHTLRNVTIQITGENNFVEIAPSTSLVNMNIEITGNDNRIIIGDKSSLKNSRYMVGGDFNVIRLGADNGLMCGITVSGSHHTIDIGNSCTVQSGSLWIEDNGCVIAIGNETTIIGADFSVTEDNSRISLGNRCLLAYGIDFRTGDSHPIFDRASGKRINHPDNIEVGDHVWIAAFVKILKGVKIGRDSVIGIGSVVTKNIPANCIAAGSPARIVRENIAWSYHRTDQFSMDTIINAFGAEA